MVKLFDLYKQMTFGLLRLLYVVFEELYLFLYDRRYLNGMAW